MDYFLDILNSNLTLAKNNWFSEDELEALHIWLVPNIVLCTVSYLTVHMLSSTNFTLAKCSVSLSKKHDA